MDWKNEKVLDTKKFLDTKLVIKEGVTVRSHPLLVNQKESDSL